MNLDIAFYDWQALKDFLIPGLIFSVQLTVVATIGGILVGTMLAIVRLNGPAVVARAADIYVTGMRSIPAVMVILWFFLLVPTWFYQYLPGGIDRRAEYSAYITFIAFEAAYFSEIVRAGIQSIAAGQVNAGRALGMTGPQTLMLIILPQAARNMLPVLLTQTIILFQDTSLVYAIGAYDLLKGFETAGRNAGRPIEAYLLAAAVYLAICFLISRVVRQVAKRIAIVR
ncbi:Glutamate/aspartate transport system permease protein gltK [Achromobacter denitrificans]|uniref:amino acid ABC transporter permease n=1 Tax=Achromobacter denitrificans TaxID=32002 RepID=UPI000786AD96|nr:amino acid ABC transporter permease [Achromobacter denitrificans]OLU05662.1 amino acid ABC transporter permease [Achromobacter denitrificans]QKH43279.1 amino acid ABC transporter permease [Achromobacter denitrificans]QKH49579.1 amino acid ABC transporter permease [Achromobacter denitrificans]CAB3711519.1 Glutamate/aspartate import permease protein GltK [Achromobacter denitrificans]SUU14646.1 Glutamate/aspartate transport system permease protein gltK [Achromobacter denitrificans]